MINYKLTAIAQKDIREIGKYTTSHWGKSKAISYIKALYERFDWITQYPHLGRERNEIKPSVMSYQENSHVIFYRIEDNGSISILRVLHSRMDFKQHF